MKKIIVFGMLLFSGLSFAAQSARFPEVKSLPVLYQSIVVCGEWQAKSQEGYRRLVVTDAFKGVGSEVYIQTIANPTQDSDARLIETVAVTELNDDHSQYTIESVRCIGRGLNAYLELRAQYEHDVDEKLHKFLLRFVGGSRYTLVKVK